ncbi:MAG: FeoB-associated Cys-rich membrane protein [Synergistes sp.]|nr:FeoB-associated Cys-rich membrane protein [Synergistes sp.]
MATFVISALIFAAVAAIIVKLVRDRRAGKCGCSCGCGGGCCPPPRRDTKKSK